MQVIGRKTNVESLIVASETLEQRLKQIDATDPQDRATALDAIEILIERYMKPGMNDPFLLAAPLDVPELDGVAGFELSGLVLSLFNERMNELEKPSDEKLKAALEEYDMPIDDKARRESFYRVWAMRQANSSIRDLIIFLEEPLVGVNRAKISSVKEEQIRIKRILENKLPAGTEYALESLYERLNRGI
jgi:hypothetical protein